MQSALNYPAHAFHDSLDNGRASGELTVHAIGFRFRTGTREVNLPLAGAQLKLGGASDRLLFITHPAHPGWSIYTSDLSVLDNEVLRAHPELSASLRRARGRRVLNWSVLAALVVAVIALPLALIFNLDYFAGVAARRIPPQWEQQLGKSAFAQYRIGTTLLEDEAARARLGALTAPLTEALQDARYPFQFHIAKDETLNAFALPGGVIVIHSELILRAQDADELLGVLAHEIAHVTEQHGLRNVISSAGVLLIAQAVIGDVGGLFGTVAGAAPLLLTMRYSRGFERDADERGVALLDRADIDAHGLISFFERIKAEQEKMREKMREEAGDRTADALEAVSGFLSSHPATEARIEHVRELAARQSGPLRSFDEDFQALQAHVRSFVAAEPSQDEQPGGTEDANTN